MQHHRIPETEILFAAADAVWEAEMVRRYGADAVVLDRDRPEARGEPGSLLRDAWVAREYAYSQWRAARCLDGAANEPEAA